MYVCMYVCVCIYVYIHIPPPENNTHWNVSSQVTKSGAGLHFLLLGLMAKAHVKGVFFAQTPVACEMLAETTAVTPHTKICCICTVCGCYMVLRITCVCL